MPSTLLLDQAVLGNVMTRPANNQLCLGQTIFGSGGRLDTRCCPTEISDSKAALFTGTSLLITMTKGITQPMSSTLVSSCQQDLSAISEMA